MAEIFDVKLKGFKELSEMLKTLPADLQLKAHDKIVKAGNDLILKEARRRFDAIPKKGYESPNKQYADIKKQIIPFSNRKRMRQGFVSKGVAATFVAGIFEVGTYHKPGGYPITAKPGKMLKFRGNLYGKEGGQGYIFAPRVNHPHLPAKPFLRPAFDSNVDNVLGLMRDRLWRFIDSYWRGSGVDWT